MELQGKRILILDDSPSRIKQLKQRLIGNVVDGVMHAKAAISHLAVHQYDVVFLDYDLYSVITSPAEYDPTDCGIVVAEWMAATRYKCQVVVHSLNNKGADAIKCLLPHAVRARWCWEDAEIFESMVNVLKKAEPVEA